MVDTPNSESETPIANFRSLCKEFPATELESPNPGTPGIVIFTAISGDFALLCAIFRFLKVRFFTVRFYMLFTCKDCFWRQNVFFVFSVESFQNIFCKPHSSPTGKHSSPPGANLEILGSNPEISGSTPEIAVCTYR